VRVVVDAAVRVGDAHAVEHLDGALAGGLLRDVVVDAVGLHDLLAHLVERVHRGERVLEDHRDLVAAQRAHLVR
jgi:hypothetical protein